MRDLQTWTRRMRRRQATIERQVVTRVLSKVWSRSVRDADHVREWWKTPMSYTRIAEIPLAVEWTRASRGDRVLELGGPKLTALALAWATDAEVVAADVDDYFVEDLKALVRAGAVDLDVAVEDAKRLSFETGAFDHVVSVSMVEHIGGMGDRQAVAEMARVVRPGGSVILTLPAWPEFVEEWQRDKRFYWAAPTDDSGRHFYQRRYDGTSVVERLQVSGLELDQMVFVAERPVRDPVWDPNGELRHNYHHLHDEGATSTVLRAMPAVIPLGRYAVHRWMST